MPPTVAKDFNDNMGAVDQKYAHTASYRIDRRHHKLWYMCMNYYGIDNLIDCEYLIFQDQDPNENKISQKDFCLSIIEDLEQIYGVAKGVLPGSNKRVRGDMDIDRAYPDRNNNVGDNIPMFSEVRGNCKYCYTLFEGKRCKGAENRTNSKWSYCEFYLCLNKKRNCFIEFHK